MIPDDDPSRSPTVANPDDPGTTHVSLVGNTHAMLVTGGQTNGRYCLIDMRVPDGGGPPPHRHDIEEMFTILEDEIEFTFRGEKHTVGAGSTINKR
jgi:quercetin dioxygenase-like cupin family protein